jgi:hypothetical protein
MIQFSRFEFGGWLLTVAGFDLMMGPLSGLHLFKNADPVTGLGFRKIF